MVEENVNAVNDNTNEPQPATEPAEQPTETTETILGGTGTTEQKAEPEQPEAQIEYDFKESIPEGVDVDEALTKEFSDIAREYKLSNEQANKMAAFGFKYGQRVAETLQAQRVAQVQQWGETAKTELGADFNNVMATAGAGIEAAEKIVPNLRQALNETGAGNRIEIIRAMEMLGKLVQADPGRLIDAGTPAVKQVSKTWYDHTLRE